MRSSKPVLLILGLLGGLACAGARSKAPNAGAGSAPRTALDVLERKQPDTKWNPKSVVEGELDQHGGPDYALSGIRGDRFVVGIVEGPVSARSKTWTLDFPWKGGGEDALCSDQAKMALEPLDSGSLAGARPAVKRPGMGLNLHDDLCDAFHISWDPGKKAFTWWRL